MDGKKELRRVNSDRNEKMKLKRRKEHEKNKIRPSHSISSGLHCKANKHRTNGRKKKKKKLKQKGECTNEINYVCALENDLSILLSRNQLCQTLHALFLLVRFSGELCAECRVAGCSHSIRIELTERMGAIGLSKNRRTLAVIAVALKSRFLEICPAFIVLARPANLYVHTCCYDVYHFYVPHSPFTYAMACVCVCVCVCRRMWTETKAAATTNYTTKMELCNAFGIRPPDVENRNRDAAKRTKNIENKLHYCRMLNQFSRTHIIIIIWIIRNVCHSFRSVRCQTLMIYIRIGCNVCNYMFPFLFPEITFDFAHPKLNSFASSPRGQYRSENFLCSGSQNRFDGIYSIQWQWRQTACVSDTGHCDLNRF